MPNCIEKTEKSWANHECVKTSASSSLCKHQYQLDLFLLYVFTAFLQHDLTQLNQLN